MSDGVCQIRRVGVTPERRAQLDLKAENGSFVWTWCINKTTITREVLAIARAVLTSNKLVFLPDGRVRGRKQVYRFGIAK
jgi:hypothetical protein